VNTYRDFVRAKLNEDMLKYVEHCNERIHGFRMDSGQRSRAKRRTCQDSAAIPAFDESRTETLTTCHDMLRCTTTSSNVELIELNKLRLRQSTRIYDWHGVPPTSASGLSARKTIRFGAAQWLTRAPRKGKTPSLTEHLQTCNFDSFQVKYSELITDKT
jgi:hypothetical protein